MVTMVTNPANPAALSRDERNLLLYLESCAVDRWGKVNAVPSGYGIRDTQQMNAADNVIAWRWHEAGYIHFREATPDEMKGNPGRAIKTTHIVRLSEAAWSTAHALRRERAERHQATVYPEREGFLRGREEDLALDAKIVCGECGDPLSGLKPEDYERLVVKISRGKPQLRELAKEHICCEDCSPINHWKLMLEEIDDDDEYE